MTRCTKIALFIEISAVVLLIYGVAGVVALSAYNTSNYASESTDALLLASELPPGFEADEDESNYYRMYAYTTRDFWSTDDDWEHGPYWITHRVIHEWIPMTRTRTPEEFFERAYTDENLQEDGFLRVETLTAPNLGPGTAWRLLVDGDDEDPVDVVVVVANRGDWYSVLTVGGNRGVVSLDQVAAIARPMIARLGTVAER